MRIRLFDAFASNNSGSYTIVGTFESAATAEDVARVLASVCEAHARWRESERDPSSNTDSAPLVAWARANALTEPSPGCDDDWPQYGPAPTVCSAGRFVLLFAPYTVTMPKAFGEYFYRREGRVQVELDHAHSDVATYFTFYIDGARRLDDTVSPEILALRERLEAALPALVERDPADDRAVIAPVLYGSTWRSLELAAVFRDVVTGTSAARALCAELGVAMWLRVESTEGREGDPFAALRGARFVPWGRFRVFLWKVGDRVRAMKAVREALQCSLEEAKRAIENLPAELLVDVDEPTAKRAVAQLLEAGCDADAGPVQRR